MCSGGGEEELLSFPNFRSYWRCKLGEQPKTWPHRPFHRSMAFFSLNEAEDDWCSIQKAKESGFIRFSLAAEPTVDSNPNMVPGIGLKFLRDGMPSSNMMAMFMLTGMHLHLLKEESRQREVEKDVLTHSKAKAASTSLSMIWPTTCPNLAHQPLGPSTKFMRHLLLHQNGPPCVPLCSFPTQRLVLDRIYSKWVFRTLQASVVQESLSRTPSSLSAWCYESLWRILLQP